MRLLAVTAVAILLGLLTQSFIPVYAQSTFDNPVIAHGADPSVVLVHGTYYSVQSGCPHTGETPVICIRAAATLPGLGNATPVVVWAAPGSGPNAQQIWAPQIDFLDGKLYIYYAGDAEGKNQHRLFALAPGTAGKPLGAWVEAATGAPHGALSTDWKSEWAIDPDVFQASDGRDYLLYSCRQDNSNAGSGRFQSICLAAMSDPLHLAADAQTGKKVVELSKPVQPWETRGFPTEEGPFGFTHDGVDYILFSGSFSGNPDQYSEGILINRHPPQPNGKGNPLINPAAWIKQGPVFDGHHAAYGTASSVLVDSPDSTELWNVYHGTDCLTGCMRADGKTWRDRSDRAQQAGWSPAGSLVMGYPIDIQDSDNHGEDVPLALPSTHGKGSVRMAAWGAAFGDAAEGNRTGGRPEGNWKSASPSAIRSTSLDPNHFDRMFFGANPNWQNYVLSTNLQMISAGSGDPHPKYGVYGAYVDRNNYFVAMVDVTSCGRPGCVATDAVVNGVNQSWQNCPLPAGFRPAAVNFMVVEAVDGAFTILVNGQTLAGACQSRQFTLSAGQPPAHGSNGQTGVVVEDTEANYSSYNVSPGVPLDSKRFNQTYAFRNQGSRMNLDNGCDGGCGAKVVDAAKVIQYPAAAPYPLNISATQLWILHEQGNGSFTIVSAMSGLCLDDPGARLTQQTCSGGASQRWRFLSAGDSSFLIQNESSLHVLDAYDSSQGTQIHLAVRVGTRAQKWQLISQ